VSFASQLSVLYVTFDSDLVTVLVVATGSGLLLYGKIAYTSTSFWPAAAVSCRLHSLCASLIGKKAKDV